MAVSANSTPFGLNVPGAYLRVNHVVGLRGERWVGTVQAYASKAIADVGGPAMRQFAVEIPWTVASPLPLLDAELRRKVRAGEVPEFNDPNASDTPD